MFKRYQLKIFFSFEMNKYFFSKDKELEKLVNDLLIVLQQHHSLVTGFIQHCIISGFRSYRRAGHIENYFQENLNGCNLFIFNLRRR